MSWDPCCPHSCLFPPFSVIPLPESVSIAGFVTIADVVALEAEAVEKSNVSALTQGEVGETSGAVWSSNTVTPIQANKKKYI